MGSLLTKPEDEEKDYLDGMDRWTRLLVTKLVPPLLESENISDDHLAQPQVEGPQKTNSIPSGDTVFKNHKEDETFGDFPIGRWIKFNVISSDLLFPVQDKFEDISDEDAQAMLLQTKLDQVFPSPNVKFQDPQSDQGLTRQAFYGLGSHRVAAADKSQPDVPADAVYMLDLMSMVDLEVRRGFAKYGGCVYFDENQKPIAIRDTTGKILKPGDGYDWEVAKAMWRTSLVLLVTAVDHLYNVHFFVSAQMVRASVEGLPTNHPVRRAIHPFCMRTALINNAAGESLLRDNSIVEHSCGLTEETLHELASAAYKTGPEWKPLPAHVASKGADIEKLIENGKLPYYQDGLELYQAIRSFFEKVVDASNVEVTRDQDLQKFWGLLLQFTDASDLPKELSRDGLLDALANFAFHVTAQHEQVGSLSDSIETPLHGGLRLTHGSVRVDKQSYIIGLVLISLTSIRTPALMSGFAKYWNSEEEKERWQSLQVDLEALSKRVDERNKTRMFAVQSSNPRILECAVSV